MLFIRGFKALASIQFLFVCSNVWLYRIHNVNYAHGFYVLLGLEHAVFIPISNAYFSGSLGANESTPRNMVIFN